VAEAAALCPSFYRAEIVENPSSWDRLVAGVRAAVIDWLETRRLRGRVQIEEAA
jgi:indolepyruvate ferredoxin oxidoreductase, alpha subunit